MQQDKGDKGAASKRWAVLVRLGLQSASGEKEVNVAKAKVVASDKEGSKGNECSEDTGKKQLNFLTTQFADSADWSCGGF